MGAVGTDVDPGRPGATSALGRWQRNPIGLIFAVLCFAVVIGIVAVGLYVMVTTT